MGEGIEQGDQEIRRKKGEKKGIFNPSSPLILLIS
jgi:hypothetical protein